ncbi:NAD(P)-dependent oxidoreductase [Rugosimonospora acidiphila]|uniref:NAD(P)-dependent oxidoreductase n=1 Tax=Rugosimonospora acidiphila TaxID=556531 RepID=A0ABP9RV94_9ACTN
MRVGWLGLGAMGGPMAACLSRAGHEVSGYDLDPARMSALAAAGGSAAASARAAVTGAEAVVVMVATPAQVEEVLFGERGAAASLAPDAVVALMATVGPEAVVDWARRLAALGVELIDAPVSGGTGRAATGDLLIMASGAPAPLAALAPLLDALARQAPTVGPAPGDGQRMKLVNQLLCGVHIAAAAEALAFAEAAGLDARACWETVRHGAAASFMLDDRGERMLAETHDDVRSALDVFVKDMDLVLRTARAHGFEAPLAGAAQRRYEAGARAGLGRRDDSVLIEIARGGGVA